MGNDGWIETARLVHRTARHDRYQAVNIQNGATIELRMFRGTLRPETLFATFALVAGMCAVARAMRAESASAAAGFMHNGTLAGLDTSPDVSDSMAYARNVLAPLKGMRGGLSGAAQRRIVEATSQGSRFLLMTGDAHVLMFGRWVADGGCLYSNESFRGRGRTGRRGAQASLFDAPGWPAAGAWPPGPFPACDDCPLAGECSDLGPWCGDAEEAEEVSGMTS